MLKSVLETVDGCRGTSVAGLQELLRIPSISTDPEHSGDMARCAQWLAMQLQEAGLSASVEPTSGHPAVLARNEHRPERATVLLYGHYDVQPAEPLDMWISPPFQPTIRDGAIYARGAADDKGQIWAHIQAIRIWQQHGGLPVNLIVLIEGEEEISSQHLETFLKQRRSELKADVALISDTGQFARGVPAITYGLRGLLYMELIVTGARHDLHSGVYGGAVPNPANILAELLASLHDPDGRVNIPGFYDEVVPLSVAERQAWAALPFDDTQLVKALGVPDLYGEKGYSTLERQWARPTCDVNGLSSGYQGPGAKTIIPARASAKVSMRLVPNQDPRRIQQAFIDTLRQRAPRCVHVDFAEHGAAAPVLLPLDSPALHLAARAIRAGFGIDPVMIREGGSIPVVSILKDVLGLESLLVGFALPDDCVHAPNEKFDLDALHCGTRTAAALYSELASLGR